MNMGKRRRVNLRADDVTWRRFKAACVESGQDVEARLGELVSSDVRTNARRKTTAQKRREKNAAELRKALREVETSSPSSASSKRGGKHAS